MLNIEENYKKTQKKTAFLQLGFRPFFSAAMAVSVLAMVAWTLIYFTGWTFPAPEYPSVHWHAHEMIYGYGMAVAAGFLLTATRNWTGVQTLQNGPLLILFLLWLLARLLPFFLPFPQLWLLAIIDLGFNLFLTIATGLPVIKVRQWHNLAFSGKILLLFLANGLFYLGLLGIWAEGARVGLYAGLYLILALLFTMGRRVIPFFIEKGVGYPFTPKNWRWLDISNLVLFLLFAIVDIADPRSIINMLLAGLLFLLNSLRLYGWYTHGIWKKPLLWSLYLGYAWLVFGFLLKTLAFVIPITPTLAVHGFAYGGIGLITAGMMARIALGHTGRDVFHPPRILHLAYSLLAAGTIVRVIFPLMAADLYQVWIGIAQGLWIATFAILFAVYTPILIRPRVDGAPG